MKSWNKLTQGESGYLKFSHLLTNVFNTLLVVILCFVVHPDSAIAQNRGLAPSGYVLTHEHPTYGMAFGGNYAFAGAEDNFHNGIMEKGYTASCGGCSPTGHTCDHGEVKGLLTASGLGSDMGAHASFLGPKYNSFSHLRYSTEWIHEAFDPSEPEFQDARMRIMVALAVESEAMCQQLYEANKGNGGAGGDGYPCAQGDSWASLKRQLDSIKKWVKENNDWMEIAYSASDARRIVNSNKLAIILGIESDYSFGAEDRTFDLVDRLNRYYDEGVRTFYLAHKVNSRLSGADIFMPRDSTGGRAIRVTQALAGCFYYDDNIGHFPLEGRLGDNLCDNNCGDNAFKGEKVTDKCAYKFGDISEVNYFDYLKRGGSAFNGFSLYPKPPGFIRDQSGGSRIGEDTDIERNNLGLSYDGERVLREAMLKGMIVNLDHVSSRSRDQMYDIATTDFDNYPLNALHNKPNSRLTNEKTGEFTDTFTGRRDRGDYRRHEYDFSDKELDYVKNTEGFFGFRMGPTDSLEYPKSGIDADCPNTSTESAKMLAWLIDQGIDVGYSLDYATVTKAVFSRTFTGCGTNISASADQLHTYGRHETDGLTHIGMMKKWHKELEAIGLETKYVNTLKNDGVEAFIRMWEKSEAAAPTGSQIPERDFASELDNSNGTCKEDSDCSANEYCARMGADPRSNKCVTLKERGQLCTDKSQCATARCSWGVCADADECRADSDCASNEFCGDPISGKRTCKALKSRGQVCTKADQCATGRCSWGVCADADECRADSDCAANEFCGDPISGKQTCKALKQRGQACTKAAQCATGRCSFGFCAEADECSSNADCGSNQYCGDPISGERTCKNLKPRGQACTKDSQCASDNCRITFTCQ